jgi:hypothetical protein
MQVYARIHGKHPFSIYDTVCFIHPSGLGPNEKRLEVVSKEKSHKFHLSGISENENNEEFYSRVNSTEKAVLSGVHGIFFRWFSRRYSIEKCHLFPSVDRILENLTLCTLNQALSNTYQ